MRLGDLDALKDIIETYRPILITSDYLQGKNNMVDYCIAEIDNAPTVEERPQGEWITVHYRREELNVPQKASMFDFVKCPFCETIHEGRRNFCSRCGADMRGKEE